MAVNLSNDKVLNGWNVLIHQAAGRSEQVFDLLQEYLTAAAIPGVTWVMDAHIIPKLGMYPAKKTDYLVVSHASLKEYHMYISARDYGSLLEVTWALTSEPGFFNKTFARVAPGIHALSNAGLDFNQQMELSAYSTAVHEGVKGAVEKVMEELNQDFTKVNTRSSGVLDLW